MLAHLNTGGGDTINENKKEKSIQKNQRKKIQEKKRRKFFLKEGLNDEGAVGDLAEHGVAERVSVAEAALGGLTADL